MKSIPKPWDPVVVTINWEEVEQYCVYQTRGKDWRCIILTMDRYDFEHDSKDWFVECQWVIL